LPTPIIGSNESMLILKLLLVKQQRKLWNWWPVY